MSAKCLFMLMTVIITSNKITAQSDELTTQGDVVEQLGTIINNNPGTDCDGTPDPNSNLNSTLSQEVYCKQLGENMKIWDEKSKGVGKGLACINFAIDSAYNQQISCPLTPEQRAILERAVVECPMQSAVFQRILDLSTEADGCVIKARFLIFIMLFLVLLIL